MITGLVYRTVRGSLPKEFQQKLDLHTKKGALHKTGWLRSVAEGMCVDAAGEPLPWYTYSAIHFLSDRIPKDAAVFEFGMGNSTMWWAARAATVASVEGDREWFDRIVTKMPANVTATLHPADSDAYVEAAKSAGFLFDLLVLDGRQRVACCKASLDSLSQRGVVIWDNAERERYAEGYDYLLARGFRRLDFRGMGPINSYEWLTTIFYRADNLLGI